MSIQQTQSRQWKLLNPAQQPAPRKAGSVVYAGSHGYSLLFGGGGKHDTWAWDGSTWKELKPKTVPPARLQAVMTYDEQRQTVVLFGGVDAHGMPLGDTWLWDGSNWQQASSTQSPQPRLGASMTYDAGQKCVVLFGGEALDGRVGALLNDTWAWDGQSWQQISTTGTPDARRGACLTYDQQYQQAVLFGGVSQTTILGDTWLLNGSQWIQAAPIVNPPARTWANLTYHAQLQQSFLVAGVGDGPTSLHDTWTWDGANWQLTVSSAPFEGGYHSLAYDAKRQELLLYATTTASKPILPGKQQTNMQPLQTTKEPTSLTCVLS
ncbi:Kelch repeat-containing protein [Tengunoibacter tsumagoiensis]|uniref:Galactose oxidase n=1 Tax=Tengunoibacter tsumagoiensis TaxID=2014871 RepID=A0A402A9Q7_9CHLR|nr:kelch repeat-containing protein [Tengunoibacter tsumagoiensis]GCE15907.1 hypothetical protein KTT_57660 [Tengunoibacter tsumagoiensis]